MILGTNMAQNTRVTSRVLVPLELGIGKSMVRMKDSVVHTVRGPILMIILLPHRIAQPQTSGVVALAEVAVEEEAEAGALRTSLDL
jgi:hypothetical protein